MADFFGGEGTHSGPLAERTPETAMLMIRDADEKGLCTIARECARDAAELRETSAGGNLAGRIGRLVKYVPDPLFNAATRIGRRVIAGGLLPVLGLARDPMGSTAITNVGGFGMPEGVHGAYANGLLPRFGYASLVVVLPIVEKAVVVDGEVVVRPILPMGFAVDHRALDGFKVFRYMSYWAEALRDPEGYFATRM